MDASLCSSISSRMLTRIISVCQYFTSFRAGIAGTATERYVESPEVQRPAEAVHIPGRGPIPYRIAYSLAVERLRF